MPIPLSYDIAPTTSSIDALDVSSRVPPREFVAENTLGQGYANERVLDALGHPIYMHLALEALGIYISPTDLGDAFRGCGM